MRLIIPEGYKSLITLKETEKILQMLKDHFEAGLSADFRLRRVTAPLFVLKGTDLETAQKLLNFMLEPACAIAVAEGQNYPPSLDPTKVALTDKIKKMPAFDPSGKLEGYLFANPTYWNAHQVEWTEKWDRIKAGS